MIRVQFSRKVRVNTPTNSIPESVASFFGDLRPHCVKFSGIFSVGVDTVWTRFDSQSENSKKALRSSTYESVIDAILKNFVD